MIEDPCSLAEWGREERAFGSARLSRLALSAALHLRLDAIDLGLRDLSGLDQRLHASRRQARARFPHAEIERRGLQSIVAAELPVVVGAVVLHALGDGPRLRPGSRRCRAGETKDQNGNSRQGCGRASHRGLPFLLCRWVSSSALVMAPPVMSTARESRFFDGGLTFAAESASSAASHKQMAGPSLIPRSTAVIASFPSRSHAAATVPARWSMPSRKNSLSVKHLVLSQVLLRPPR